MSHGVGEFSISVAVQVVKRNALGRVVGHRQIPRPFLALVMTFNIAD